MFSFFLQYLQNALFHAFSWEFAFSLGTCDAKWTAEFPVGPMVSAAGDPVQRFQQGLKVEEDF